MVTDALTIQRYYLERWRKPSVFIPYGAETGKAAGTGTLENLGLERLAATCFGVSRMEPENHPLEVREAFEDITHQSSTRAR